MGEYHLLTQRRIERASPPPSSIGWNPSNVNEERRNQNDRDSKTMETTSEAPKAGGSTMAYGIKRDRGEETVARERNGIGGDGVGGW